jgi:hypothetical protein
MPEVRSAVEAMPEGVYKDNALNAFQRGGVLPNIFGWSPY